MTRLHRKATVLRFSLFLCCAILVFGVLSFLWVQPFALADGARAGVAPAVAGQPGRVEVGAMQEGTGSITGTVQMTLGGPAPVFARVNVCLVTAPADCLQAGGPGPGKYQVVVNGDGSYELAGLPPGDYNLLFEGDIYQNRNNVYYNQAATLEEADPVTVVADAITDGIDATFVGFSHITGKVTKEGGAGLAGAQVLVCVAENSLTCEPPSWPGGSATTDPNGNYDLNRLDAGTYRLRFSHPNYLTEYYNNKEEFADAQTVTVGIEETEPEINAQLTGAATITGVVQSENGNTPIANARIRFQSVSSGDIYLRETNALGAYSVAPLPEGAYMVQFRAPAGNPDGWLTTEVPIMTVAGESQTLNQVLVVGRVISGTVTVDGGGAPSPGIRVQTCPVSDGCTSTDDFDHHFVDTDGNGDYQIGGLAPGAYYLVFAMANSPYVSELYQEIYGFQNAANVDVTGATQINLTSAFSAEIDAELSLPASLGGTVTAQDGGGALAGITVTSCRVALSACYLLAPATTNANGAYLFDRLSPGTYRVRFTDNRPTSLYAELQPPSITIDAEEEATLNVVMQRKPTATPTPGITPSGTPSVSPTPSKTPTPTPSPTPPPTVVATLVVMPNTAAQTTIDEAQGLKAGQRITIEIPAGAVTEPTIFSIGLLNTPPAARSGLGELVFTISATQGGAPAEGLQFDIPIILTIVYRDRDIAGLVESELAVRFFHERSHEWRTDGITVVAHDLAENRIVVTVAHLTTFALFQANDRALLPLITR